MFKDKRLLFIFFTIFLDTLGIGLLVPIIPKIVGRFATSSELISEYFGVFVGVYAFMQFIAAPVLGALSDRYGRKKILLISLFGAALDYLVMAYAPSLPILLLGRMISGLTGASMTVASSYVADITAPEDRATSYGFIGAAWGLGFIAGPSLGSLFNLAGPLYPFYAASLFNLVNFIFGLLILPESLSPANRRQVALKELNPLRAIFKIFTIQKINHFVWIYFLIFMAGQVLPVNWTLYTELKFHWSPLQLGLSLSAMGITVALSQALLTRLLIPRWGEEKSLIIGLYFYAFCFFVFGVATSEWLIYLNIMVFSLTGIAMPSLQSLMTREIPSNQQGEIQGSLVSLGSLSAVLAPLFFMPVYVHFTNTNSSYYFPGAVFVLASILSLLTSLLWLYHQKRKVLS